MKTAQARTLSARMAKVTTGIATLDTVRVRLDWPAGASSGRLQLEVARLRAPGLGYDLQQLRWDCRLQRQHQGWVCDGAVQQANGTPRRLALDLSERGTQATLSGGGQRLDLMRDARHPDLTTLDLTAIPVTWVEGLLQRAWPSARIDGTLGGRLAIETPGGGAVRVHGPLKLNAISLKTTDSSVLGERLALDTQLDYRSRGLVTSIGVHGTALGDVLIGNTFLGLQDQPVGFALDAIRDGNGPWRIPRIRWHDGNTLQADGSFMVGSDGSLRNVDLRVDSPDTSGLRERYLSGWLALVGMNALDLRGRLSGRVTRQESGSSDFRVEAHGLDLEETAKRLGLKGLRGSLRLSPGERVESELQWEGGRLYGMQFGPAGLPLVSQNGEVALRGPAAIPFFDGTLRFDRLRVVPPRGTDKTRIDFALTADRIDFGKFAKAVGLPAFRGTLSGVIPNAHYADDVLTMDGGLGMQLFEGDVRISSLAIERPFGPATTLVSNIDFTSLDLLRLTEVLGFGSITGRLDGHLHDLRLVDWTPVRFDAELRTRKVPGVRQRISQRAVQNISSVGDSSFVGSLQGRAIGLFKDFGYQRIGIHCRLVNDVCTMWGLGEDSTPRSDAQGFTIVEGAGIPRLSVVGYNRRVDWPTLVERLSAAAEGDVKPVVGGNK